MTQDHDFERMFRQEFCEIINNIIWQNLDGAYEVFNKYRIIPVKKQYRVMCRDNQVAVFNSTRSALSWCIADKNQDYNLADELLVVDSKLGYVTDDINTRANLADRSKKPDFRENIGTKLETKIIHKKALENQLTKCVNLAKYWQQRGFNNETARTGRNTTNKTNR